MPSWVQVRNALARAILVGGLLQLPIIVAGHFTSGAESLLAVGTSAVCGVAGLFFSVRVGRQSLPVAAGGGAAVGAASAAIGLSVLYILGDVGVETLWAGGFIGAVTGALGGLIGRFRHRLRLVRRWLRSLLGVDVFQRRQCTVPILSLGHDDGRWSICPLGLGPDTVVYSFGVGRDIGFERELIERFGLTVHAFDPTPVSLEWLRSEMLPQGFILHGLGIANYDGLAPFMPPRGRALESFSMVRPGSAGAAVQAPVCRLATIMATLGHLQVDVLKMDIEGAEYQVLPDILRGGISPSQILVEFHHRWKEIGPVETRRVIDLLNQHGFLVADLSPLGREYVFVRRDLVNAVPKRPREQRSFQPRGA